MNSRLFMYIIYAINIFIAIWISPLAASERDVIFAAEIEQINGLLDGKPANVFYIYMFGGLMPIPNRYAVNSRLQAETGKLELFSPNGLEWPRINLSDSVQDISGFITIGRYKEFKNDYTKNKSRIKVIQSITRGELIIEVSSHLDIPGQQVLIHDDDEYMLMADENKQLWEAVLSVYFHIKNSQNAARKDKLKTKK